MRSLRALWGASAGILNQMTRSVLALIVRRMFLFYISAEYLGLNTLFGSIILFLSLSELGVGTAISLYLYKPLAQHDYIKANSYISALKTFNYIMMVIILVGGTCLIPVVFSTVNGDYSDIVVLKAYILYLVGTASSYFWSCYNTLLSADQKSYKVDLVSCMYTVIINLIQILIIGVFRNYYAYLWTQIIYNLMTNYTLRMIAKREYPWLGEKAVVLTKREKLDIISKIKDMFVYRIAGYLIQSFDNIIVSVLLGTVMVAYYGNYCLIVNMLVAIVGNIGGATLAGLGNAYYIDDECKIFGVLKKILFLQYMIFSSAAVAMLVLANDFVQFFFGNESLCSRDVVISITLFCFLRGIIIPLENIRIVAGCYDDKYWQLLVSAMNVIISIVLTYLIGLSGVIIGTVICYLVKGFILMPEIVFKKVISRKFKREYMKDLIMLCILFCFMCLISMFIPSMDNIPFIFRFLIKGILTVVGVSLLNIILLSRTSLYKENKSYFIYTIKLWLNNAWVHIKK
jgi:O-antigen/teichoic acid export membrane protein